MKILGMAAALVLFCGSVAGAHEYKAGGIDIHHPAVNATPGGAKVAAGYLTLKNEGDVDDRLVSVASPEMAEVTEIHSMDMDGGIMKMRRLEDGVALPAGQSVELSPHGMHVMFMKLKAPLVEGQTYNAVLTFEKAGAVDVVFNVEAAGSMPKADAGGADGHGAHGEAAPAEDHSGH